MSDSKSKQKTQGGASEKDGKTKQRSSGSKEGAEVPTDKGEPSKEPTKKQIHSKPVKVVRPTIVTKTMSQTGKPEREANRIFTPRAERGASTSQQPNQHPISNLVPPTSTTPNDLRRKLVTKRPVNPIVSEVPVVTETDLEEDQEREEQTKKKKTLRKPGSIAKSRRQLSSDSDN